MTALEIVATVFGLACVGLTIRRNIWCWPTGLIQVILFIWIFYQAKLYSDVILHVIYIAMSLYGWWYWLRGGRDRSEPPVTRLSLAGLGLWVLVGLVGTAALGTAMRQYTDASLPYWDAATTSLSLVAQYLMARKLLESWGFWIIVDVLAIGVYLVKGLHVTSGLYAVFLVLAVMGLIAWTRSMLTPAIDPAAA